MKRVVAITVVLLMFFSILQISASAVSPVIFIDNKEAVAGEKVTVCINISGNPGITAMYLKLKFDAPLQLTAVRDCGLLNGKYFSSKLSAVPYVLSWDEPLEYKDNSSSGKLCELDFTVPDGTPAGVYKISVVFGDDDIYNSQLHNIFFEAEEGSVTVKKNNVFEDSDTLYRSGEYFYFTQGTTVGDIKKKSVSGISVRNGDGKMNDSALLCSGNILSFPDKSSYICVLKGDIDSDGHITASDARLVLRKSVGLEVFSSVQTVSAEVDYFSGITASDARLILRASVGLENAQNWVKRIQTDTVFLSPETALTEKTVQSSLKDYNEAGRYISGQLKAFNKQVDISKYNIKLEDGKMLIKEFINIVPELFYVVNNVTVMSMDGIIKTMEFTFIENAREKLADFNGLISSVALLADKSWSDVQKILFFHDYICANFSYDEELLIYDAYSMLKNGKGVCQAYTLLMKALLEYHSIESKYVTSEKMKHGWNLVKAGSQWYHVDVTWDDMDKNILGRALHENLLLSDNAMENNGHKDWYCFGGNERCSSEAYDNYFWQSVSSPFVCLNDKWYFTDKYSSGFAVFQWHGEEKKTVVQSFDAFWTGFLGISRNENYSFLCEYDNKLIYNIADSVISFDPESLERKILYAENTSKQIFGMLVKDRIYINLSSLPQASQSDIIAAEIFDLGDVDSDGRLTPKDYTLLVRCLAGHNIQYEKSNCDIDRNGKLNAKDSEELRKFLVNCK